MKHVNLFENFETHYEFVKSNKVKIFDYIRMYVDSNGYYEFRRGNEGGNFIYRVTNGKQTPIYENGKPMPSYLQEKLNKLLKMYKTYQKYNLDPEAFELWMNDGCKPVRQWLISSRGKIKGAKFGI